MWKPSSCPWKSILRNMIFYRLLPVPLTDICVRLKPFHSDQLFIPITIDPLACVVPVNVKSKQQCCTVLRPICSLVSRLVEHAATFLVACQRNRTVRLFATHMGRIMSLSSWDKAPNLTIFAVLNIGLIPLCWTTLSIYLSRFVRLAE